MSDTPSMSNADDYQIPLGNMKGRELADFAERHGIYVPSKYRNPKETLRQYIEDIRSGKILPTEKSPSGRKAVSEIAVAQKPNTPIVRERSSAPSLKPINLETEPLHDEKSDTVSVSNFGRDIKIGKDSKVKELDAFASEHGIKVPTKNKARKEMYLAFLLKSIEDQSGGSEQSSPREPRVQNTSVRQSPRVPEDLDEVPVLGWSANKIKDFAKRKGIKIPTINISPKTELLRFVTEKLTLQKSGTPFNQQSKPLSSTTIKHSDKSISSNESKDLPTVPRITQVKPGITPFKPRNSLSKDLASPIKSKDVVLKNIFTPEHPEEIKMEQSLDEEKKELPLEEVKKEQPLDDEVKRGSVELTRSVPTTPRVSSVPVPSTPRVPILPVLKAQSPRTDYQKNLQTLTEKINWDVIEDQNDPSYPRNDNKEYTKEQLDTPVLFGKANFYLYSFPDARNVTVGEVGKETTLGQLFFKLKEYLYTPLNEQQIESAIDDVFGSEDILRDLYEDVVPAAAVLYENPIFAGPITFDKNTNSYVHEFLQKINDEEDEE